MNDRPIRIYVYALMAFFLLKALIVGFLVTPRWDVPDETGHFAYIQELRSGSLPVLGRSMIPASIVRDWKGTDTPEQNWISQHPPLYHLAAIPFVSLAELLTDDSNLIFRSPRILSALLGAATLYALFSALVVASGSLTFAASCATILAFTPMFTHLAGGTNHDVAVALLASVAGRYFFLARNAFSWSTAYKLAAVLAAAGVVKMSTVPVTIILLVLLIFENRAKASIFHSMAVTAIALLPPSLWLMRNYAVTGSTQLLAPSRPPELGVIGFFTTHPVIEHTIKNFIGLIGWTGTGQGELRWLQIGGIAYAPFFLLIVLATAAATFHYGMKATRASAAVRALTLLGWIAAVGVLLTNLPHSSAGEIVKSTTYGLFVSLFAFGFLALDRRERDVDTIAILVIAFFTAAYGLRIWNAFLATGAMRATHGRYFFAVMPFLALAYLYPAFRLAREHRVEKGAMIAASLLMIVGEAFFYLYDVMPFFA